MLGWKPKRGRLWVRASGVRPRRSPAASSTSRRARRKSLSCWDFICSFKFKVSSFKGGTRVPRVAVGVPPTARAHESKAGCDSPATLDEALLRLGDAHACRTGAAPEIFGGTPKITRGTRVLPRSSRVLSFDEAVEFGVDLG